MATNYNARIATRGLALSVDAANVTSLPTGTKLLYLQSLIPNAENMSAWALNAVGVATNVIIAPDGTMSGDAITEDGSITVHYITKTGIPVTAGLTYTVSIFAKAGSRSVFAINTNVLGGRTFDLSTGLSSAGPGINAASWAMTPAGNGWYRCSITGVASGSSLEIYFQTNFTINGAWYLWGAQLEQNSSPSTYYPLSSSVGSNTRWNDLTGTSRPVPLDSLLTSVEYLIVAGGGGGGQVNGDNGGGGGGGGGVLTGSTAIVPQAYNVIVGAGGLTLRDAVNDVDAVGGNSSFGSIVASGGGYGGGYINGISIVRFNGFHGGSSGGSSVNAGAIAATPVGQGFIGGFGLNGWGGGGGGGAGGAGGTTTATTTAIAGAGGPGILSSISGNPTYYAGGGGGGGTTGRQSDLDLGGPGGIGGGGRGGTNRVNSLPGTPNTGGGGGGGGGGLAPGETFASRGGSGIVILRYLGSPKATGGVITSAGGFTIHTFTTSGTFTPISPQSANVSYGTFQNNVTYDSRNSGALVFDNNTSYVAFPDLSSQTNSPLSVFAWVFLNATPATINGIWGHYGVNNNNIHFEVQPTVTRLRLGDTNKGDLPMLAIGSWQFVGFTSTGTSHRYYVNGVLSTTWAGSTGTILGGNGTFPSSHMIGRSDATKVWNGRIAQVAIYNAELTAAEVLNNFNALRGRYAV